MKLASNPILNFTAQRQQQAVNRANTENRPQQTAEKGAVSARFPIPTPIVPAEQKADVNGLETRRGKEPGAEKQRETDPASLALLQGREQLDASKFANRAQSAAKYKALEPVAN